MSEKIYDVLIVGAGTAGMTAAIYALRAKKSVLLLESVTPGGQIINTHKIDNYPAAHFLPVMQRLPSLSK